MRQIIYLEPTDHIATIRDRLRRAQANEVLLVLPPHYEELRNLVNLKLLKRCAQDLAIDLALVVRDRQTRTLAREVGLILASSVGQARTIPLKRPSKRRIAPAVAAAGVSARARPLKTKANPLARALALLFLLGLLGALAATFVFVVLPGATLTLVPATQYLETEMEIVAVPGLTSIDYEKGRIPAKVVTVELTSSGSTPTTGKRDIPDAHAEGRVVFANKTSGPVTVPKNTIVRTSSGTPVRFYTVTDLELPATWGAHGRVGIIAVEPGPQGNVKALTINEVEGEIAFQVDVINDEPTRGGTLKRVNEVTGEDMGRLRNTLLQRIHQEAYAKLQAELSETEFIPADTVLVETIEAKFDQQAGAVADVLNLTLRVRATGTVVGGEEANTLILRMLESRVPPGYALLPESLRFQPGQVLATEGASVRFKMGASGTAVADIDVAEVRRGIAGKEEPEAIQYLLDRWDFEAAPELQITPQWIGRVPWIPYRIAVKISPADTRAPRAP